ncbi:MAG: tetratricopeptide repeat protein, partial [Deltaproteobacteria bacterium]|nr:tetratricopeptide repeat protein [Deltaproteobacteria bacterium]
AFMSPEQARGEAADVQSDVYALGALLYQLIAGRPAYEGKNSLEVLQQVRKGPPPLLTSVVPEVAPELASMVARAMAPEKSKRTASAAELSEELKNFQTGRLVPSHAYSSWELLVRWARRNRMMLSATAVFVAVLAAVGTVSVRRILAERERANREAATARRVSGFMTDMFKLSDPGVSRGNSVTVREVLDKSAKDLKSGLSEDPEVRARLLESMGTVYSNLGLYPEAQGPLDEAEATLLKERGPDDPEVLNASLQRVIVLRRMSRFDEAEKAAAVVSARATRVLGPSSEITLEALNQLGVAQRRLKKPKESEATLLPALALSRAKVGNEAELTLQLMNNLAVAEGSLQKFAEEEKLLTEVIATRKRVNGPDAPTTLGAMNNLGGLYHALHRDDEAAQVFQEVWEADKRVLGPDHPDTVNTLTNTAALLFMNSRYKQVEPLVREIVAARERRMGPENAETLDALNNLSAVLLRLAKWDEAEAVITRARAGWLKTKGPNDSDLAIATSRLAFLDVARGKKAEALQLLQEAVPHLENKIDALEDPLLTPLHGDPQYEAMLMEAKARPRP